MMEARAPLVVALVAASAIASPNRDRATAAPAAAAIEFAAAEHCGRCHRDIHRYWKASMHAQAADNWRFQDALQGVRRTGGTDAEALCLRCHAPAVVYTGDAGWIKKPSWEGVTCDFCHSVTSVRSDPDRPFVLDVGKVKTGPLKDARPVGHAARYSDVHTSSALCAPCHGFVNRLGLDVLATYAEWQASPYAAKNVTCQACHMRAATGRVVDPKVARAPHSPVNLHEMPGGHSTAELNRALLARITAARRRDEVDVTVEVTNRGAGHHVPTGSPLRAIEMVVEVDSGISRREQASRTFRRVVVDEGGRELADEAAVWLRGARVADDTRLAAQERRVERFTFKMPPHTPVRAVAKFFYHYTPVRAQPMPFLAVSAWLDAAPP